jgi:hypothetical protein
VRKILVLSANPKSTDKIRLDEEFREIDEGLKRASQRDQFGLTSQWAVRERDFYRSMLEVQPQIVHFSGHGGGEEGIVLEDEMGTALLLPTDQLTGLFKLFASKGLECVVLNACFSKAQARAISEHIPYVVGMNRAIGDKAAIKFAVAFYDALGGGETVKFAFDLACTQLIGLKEHENPVLYEQTKLMAETQFAKDSRAEVVSESEEPLKKGTHINNKGTLGVVLADNATGHFGTINFGTNDSK